MHHHLGISRSRLVSVALVAGLTCLVSGLARAGAGQVTTVVTPLSPNVSYGIAATLTTPALKTWVGYRVEIANAGGNTINAIRFTGSTLVTDGAEQALFSSVEGVERVRCHRQRDRMPDRPVARR